MAPIATPKPLATGIAKPPASVAPKMKKAATIATKNTDKSKGNGKGKHRRLMMVSFLL